MGKWKRRRKEKIKEGENKNNEKLCLRFHSFQPHANEMTFFQYRMMYVRVHFAYVIEISMGNTFGGIQLSSSVEQYVEIEFSGEEL